MTSNSIDMFELGRMIKAKRKEGQLTLEKVAKITGVSASTLSRLERFYEGKGRTIKAPDVKTLTSLANWLKAPIEHFVIEGHKAVEEDQLRSVPEKLEAHLRADRNLTREEADTLGKLFKMAYDQIAKSSKEET